MASSVNSLIWEELSNHRVHIFLRKDKSLFSQENNVICYLSENIFIEQQPVGNFMFSGEMEEHAPVQLGVVRPALLRTQRTLPSGPLQDLTDGLLAILPEKNLFLEVKISFRNI